LSLPSLADTRKRRCLWLPVSSPDPACCARARVLSDSVRPTGAPVGASPASTHPGYASVRHRCRTPRPRSPGSSNVRTAQDSSRAGSPEPIFTDALVALTVTAGAWGLPSANPSRCCALRMKSLLGVSPSFLPARTVPPGRGGCRAGDSPLHRPSTAYTLKGGLSTPLRKTRGNSSERWGCGPRSCLRIPQ
jgi:hypothetical protein